MLTINADQHPVMNAFHKPTDEKRMVVSCRRNDLMTGCPRQRCKVGNS
jgi:hypothetical protein